MNRIVILKIKIKFKKIQIMKIYKKRKEIELDQKNSGKMNKNYKIK